MSFCRFFGLDLTFVISQLVPELEKAEHDKENVLKCAISRFPQMHAPHIELIALLTSFAGTFRGGCLRASANRTTTGSEVSHMSRRSHSLELLDLTACVDCSFQPSTASPRLTASSAWRSPANTRFEAVVLLAVDLIGCSLIVPVM